MRTCVYRLFMLAGLILALCIVCAVVLFIGLILAFAFLSSTLTRVAMETEIYEEEYDDPYSGDYFDEFGDYDSGYYVPDEDDPYYREITVSYTASGGTVRSSQ